MQAWQAVGPVVVATRRQMSSDTAHDERTCQQRSGVGSQKIPSLQKVGDVACIAAGRALQHVLVQYSTRAITFLGHHLIQPSMLIQVSSSCTIAT